MGDKLYWTGRLGSGSGDGLIQRANLDGSNVTTLVSDLTSPTGLALDETKGKLYWTDVEARTIQRADLNGSNIEPLVSVSDQFPAGIALDVWGGKMYWAGYEGNAIQRANLDGDHIETLVSGLSLPTSIALLRMP